MGYAPGWQVRCPKCGAVKPAGEVGMTRIGAKSKGKRTLIRCWNCRKLTMAHVEESTESDL